MKQILMRSILVWLLIIAAETIHGILRTILLSRVVGDFLARQLAVFSGCFLIFIITRMTIRWIRAVSKRQLLSVGVIWVVLTVLFEVVLGKFILDLPWKRTLEDYDLTRGGLLGLGQLFLLLVPLLTGKLIKLDPAARSR